MSFYLSFKLVCKNLEGIFQFKLPLSGQWYLLDKRHAKVLVHRQMCFSAWQTYPAVVITEIV